MIAGFSDGAGRRPAYVACFIIYILANIGLALQSNYVAPMILRAVQSAGSSGTVALSNGCAGDIVTSSERGTYIAYASISSVLGTSLAPILGGVLSQYLGWKSVFWFLTIFAGVYFLPLMLFFPETCRKVVGDGTVPPPKWNQSITGYLREKERIRSGTLVDPVQQAYVTENYRLRFPNPFSTLVIVADKEAGLILFSQGLVLACFYAISAGVPSQYKEIYNFSDLELGFVFLPMSVGTIVSAFTTGKMVDWNYRKHARRHGLPVVRNRQEDLSNFPIEKVRLQVALPLLYVGAATVIAYGWALHYEANLAVPLVLVFVLGYSVNAANQCMSILMVDIWPGRPATATAAANLVRCSLGAASSAVVIPMLNKLGRGWTYTTLALIWVAFSPFVWMLMKSGLAWRRQRKEKEEKAKADKQKAREERMTRGVKWEEQVGEPANDGRVANEVHMESGEEVVGRLEEKSETDNAHISKVSEDRANDRQEGK